MSSPSPLLDPSSPEYKKAQRLHRKTTKNRDPEINAKWTPFRAAEKYFKAHFPPPDLSNVLDLATLDPSRSQEVQQGGWHGGPRSDVCEEQEGPHGTKFYTFPSIPGLVVLPSFVSQNEQRNLARWALSEHAKPPNATNLDTHYHIPDEGVWNATLRSRADPSADITIQPRNSTESESVNYEPVGPRQLVNNTPATPSTYNDIASTPKPPQAPSSSVRSSKPVELLPKLRWANIGWFYHWGTKQYDFAQGPGTIQPLVRNLCKKAIAEVNWEAVYQGTDLCWEEEEPGWKSWNDTYEPDAGIVNFYQVKDTLMAHVDRSEVCATSPLVSISLGNAAIFLIGSTTRDSEPIPILLRSGDTVIMSGPVCRRAYHGVPRILDGTLPSHLVASEDDKDWVPYGEYLETTRINVNVRQVFPKGFNPLNPSFAR